MKIDNMREEHQEKLIKEAEKLVAEQKAAAPKEPRKSVGFIAVSIGSGMNEIFKELGVDYIIEGGQTMNPSTEDMLTAIDHVNADHIFNSSEQQEYHPCGKSGTVSDERQRYPCDSDPHGSAGDHRRDQLHAGCRCGYERRGDAGGNQSSEDRTGDLCGSGIPNIDDKEIHEGDIMGIGDDGILSVGPSVEGSVKEMLEIMADEDTELISLYYGEDVQEEDAERLAEEIADLYPDADVDMHSGGQPIYYYVLSVE